MRRRRGPSKRSPPINATTGLGDARFFISSSRAWFGCGLAPKLQMNSGPLIPCLLEPFPHRDRSSQPVRIPSMFRASISVRSSSPQGMTAELQPGRLRPTFGIKEPSPPLCPSPSSGHWSRVLPAWARGATSSEGSRARARRPSQGSRSPLSPEPGGPSETIRSRSRSEPRPRQRGWVPRPFSEVSAGMLNWAIYWRWELVGY